VPAASIHMDENRVIRVDYDLVTNICAKQRMCRLIHSNCNQHARRWLLTSGVR
jgi:hypothetical protein